MMRRSYVRFGQDRRAIFLKALKQTGLVTIACERAGIHRDTAYAHRSSDTLFATSWGAAMSAFRGRQEDLAGARQRFVDLLFQADGAEAGR